MLIFLARSACFWIRPHIAIRCVRPSVRPSVHLSVCPSAHLTRFPKLRENACWQPLMILEWMRDYPGILFNFKGTHANSHMQMHTHIYAHTVKIQICGAAMASNSKTQTHKHTYIRTDSHTHTHMKKPFGKIHLHKHDVVNLLSAREKIDKDISCILKKQKERILKRIMQFSMKHILWLRLYHEIWASLLHIVC